MSVKKLGVAIVGTIVVLTIILLLVSQKVGKKLPSNQAITPSLPPEFFQVQGPVDKGPIPTVPAFPTYTLKPNQKVLVQPQSTSSIPTANSGVDTNNATVADSTSQIQILSSALPLTLTTTLATKLTVDINIPSADLQPNTWTLFVDIAGIDFGVQPSDTNYVLMRNSFREAANDVFVWVKNQGADPTKIYFVWGDKAYQQQTAENWLKN